MSTSQSAKWKSRRFRRLFFFSFFSVLSSREGIEEKKTLPKAKMATILLPFSFFSLFFLCFMQEGGSSLPLPSFSPFLSPPLPPQKCESGEMIPGGGRRVQSKNATSFSPFISFFPFFFFSAAAPERNSSYSARRGRPFPAPFFLFPPSSSPNR